MDSKQRFAASLGRSLILGAQENRDRRRVPVVAVDDIRNKTDQGQGLQSRPAEIGILFAFGVATFIDRSAEVIFVVDEIIDDIADFDGLHAHILGPPSQMHIEVADMPQLPHIFAFDLAVERQHDPHIQPQLAQLPGQRPDHVRQASGLCKGRAFRPHNQYFRVAAGDFHYTIAPFLMITG